MSDSQPKGIPKTLPASGGGPPVPPNGTSLSFGDGSPEEVSRIRVTVPEVMQVDVLSYLNLLSGVITNIEEQAISWTTIAATLPTGYLHQFRSWLGEFSKGQGRIAEELG